MTAALGTAGGFIAALLTVLQTGAGNEASVQEILLVGSFLGTLAGAASGIVHGALAHADYASDIAGATKAVGEGIPADVDRRPYRPSSQQTAHPQHG